MDCCLWLNRKKISNAAEIIDNFDLAAVRGYFLGGSLSEWLREHGGTVYAYRFSLWEWEWEWRFAGRGSFRGSFGLLGSLGSLGSFGSYRFGSGSYLLGSFGSFPWGSFSGSFGAGSFGGFGSGGFITADEYDRIMYECLRKCPLDCYGYGIHIV